MAGYERYAPESLARRHSICSGPACVLVATVVGIAIVVAVATPASGVAIWSFFGVSMLGCVLYTPIDVAEARGKRSRAVSAP
jgi:hypothetical protein